jgi:excisionase family DNA binding protein
MIKQYKLDDYGDILNPKDVQEILGIGRKKTYELLQNGDIKNFKIGSTRKIPKHCLESYINDMLR